MRHLLEYTRFALFSGALLLFSLSAVLADEAYSFDQVDRIVAVGDLHGDFEAYAVVMKAAGVRNEKGKWIGGKTHLVQMGDITDRGPDSKKILDDLRKLAKRAEKAGGHVHILLGNHELMNIVGALDYVTPEEYEAFRTYRSKDRLDAYFERAVRPTFEAEDEERKKELEAEWYRAHPPGFIEHRLAWGKGGKYYDYAIEFPVVIKINDTLFAHAGISPKYAGMPIASLNALARRQIETLDDAALDDLFAEDGLFWYRGLALDEGDEAASFVQLLLEGYGAERFVIAHTPTGGVVLPRFDGRVIVNDVGIAEYYGGHQAFLLYENGRWYGVHWGKKIPLPAPGKDSLLAYLQEVCEVSPNPGLIAKRMKALREGLPFSVFSSGNGEESPSQPSGDR